MLYSKKVIGSRARTWQNFNVVLMCLLHLFQEIQINQF